MSYYYVKDGNTHGPASLDDLRELCRRGEIPPDTNVCTEGADSWQPLSALGPIDDFPEREQAQQPEPPPVSIPQTPVASRRASPRRASLLREVAAPAAPAFLGITSGQGTAIIIMLILAM